MLVRLSRAHAATFYVSLCFFVVLLITPVTAERNAVRRVHANVRALGRKRAPFPDNISPPGAVAAAGKDVPTFSSQGPLVFSSASTPTSTPAASSTLSSTSSTSTDTNLLPLLSPGDTSISLDLSPVLAGASSLSSSSSRSRSSTTSSSTASSSATHSTAVTTTAGAIASTVVDTIHPTVQVTMSASPSSSSAAAVSGASKTATTTLTVIIVVASSVGGVVVLWTIFRKWKLGRSAKFDKRLNPIEWQPEGGRGLHADEDGIAAHRRNTSATSSFHSGQDHAALGRSGSSSSRGHGADRLEHDFTPGPAAAGYVTLARHPSARQEMAQVGQPYYTGGVPLYSQGGFGAAPDPFGYSALARR